jgi:uncharacterized membrane protein YgcG
MPEDKPLALEEAEEEAEDKPLVPADSSTEAAAAPRPPRVGVLAAGVGVLVLAAVLLVLVAAFALAAPLEESAAPAPIPRPTRLPACTAEWVEESACSGCGTEGFAVRRLVVRTAASADGQPLCEQPAAATIVPAVGTTELYPCSTGVPCPAVDCVGAFESWGECSLPCGGGTRIRSFVVSAQAQYGGVCPDDGVTETEDCNVDECPPPPPDPVDCVGAWSDFSECSELCGPDGVRERTFVVETLPAHGGAECNAVAGDVETESCNTEVPCPPAWPNSPILTAAMRTWLLAQLPTDVTSVEECYNSATDDTSGPGVFHMQCDTHNRTLTVLRVVSDGHHMTFGGYAGASWSLDACCARNSGGDYGGSWDGGSGDGGSSVRPGAGSKCNARYNQNCWDSSAAASSSFIFSLAPGDPVRYDPNGENVDYLKVDPNHWQQWGYGKDLFVAGARPLGDNWGMGQMCGITGMGMSCGATMCDDHESSYDPGVIGYPSTYTAPSNAICGGNDWLNVQMEVWALV